MEENLLDFPPGPNVITKVLRGRKVMVSEGDVTPGAEGAKMIQ